MMASIQSAVNSNELVDRARAEEREACARELDELADRYELAACLGYSDTAYSEAKVKAVAVRQAVAELRSKAQAV